MSKHYSLLIVKREMEAERETERMDCNDNGWLTDKQPIKHFQFYQLKFQENCFTYHQWTM